MKHAWPTEVRSVYALGDYAPRKIIGFHILKVRKMPDGNTVACETMLHLRDLESYDKSYLPYTLDKMKRKMDAAVHAHGRHAQR